MPPFVVAIPARYAASRLPGKPLRLLGGTPLVVHVARRALAAGAEQVWVATDDARIRDALAGTEVQVAMTSERHASGSEARLPYINIPTRYTRDANHIIKSTVPNPIPSDNAICQNGGVCVTIRTSIATGAENGSIDTQNENAESGLRLTGRNK